MRVYEMTSKAVFLLIVFGSIITIIRGVDDVFPFSSYSMYSEVFEPDLFLSSTLSLWSSLTVKSDNWLLT